MKRRARGGRRAAWLIACVVTACDAVHAADPAEAVRWIAIGGGAEPASTQVSLEQDLALAARTFGPRGVLLFAGGTDAFGVQVQREQTDADSLLAELGEIFDPREGRTASYRRPALAADGPASLDRFLAVFETALRAGEAPLLVYAATHGERGDDAAENMIRLWGGFGLTATRLAEVLDGAGSERRVRFVIGACFSGGFAELAFAGADPARGAPLTDQCGFFATTADEYASGCDPNPDRRVQEGYGLHFLHALRGEDRDGRRLPSEQIDFDGDGRCSLLEAHTRARIAGDSFDMPVTTSERWLRAVAPPSGPDTLVALPEEMAVIVQLGRRLGVGDAAAAAARLAKTEAELKGSETTLEEAGDAHDDAAADLRIALLERWPVLDDPWHPEFAAEVTRHRAAIGAFLRRALVSRAYRRARAAHDAAAGRYDDRKVAAAALRRLTRAHETRALAQRLAAAGGPAWEQYQRVLACERSQP